MNENKKMVEKSVGIHAAIASKWVTIIVFLASSFVCFVYFYVFVFIKLSSVNVYDFVIQPHFPS